MMLTVWSLVNGLNVTHCSILKANINPKCNLKTNSVNSRKTVITWMNSLMYSTWLSYTCHICPQDRSPYFAELPVTTSMSKIFTHHT